MGSALAHLHTFRLQIPGIVAMQVRRWRACGRLHIIVLPSQQAHLPVAFGS